MIDAVVFWGARGHARVLRELLGADGPRLIALFDSDPTIESPWADVPIHHGRAGFDRWRAAQSDVARIGCLVAIGGHRAADRIGLQRDLVAAGLTPLVAR